LSSLPTTALANFRCKNCFPGIGQSDTRSLVSDLADQPGRVQNVAPVGSGQNNDLMPFVKAVHLYQELVKGLFALVVCLLQTGSSAASHGIEFIDEDNGWSSRFGLFKEAAHVTRPSSHDLRGADGEEWHTRFSRHCSCKQCLVGSRLTHEKYAPRNTDSQSLLTTCERKAVDGSS